MENGFQFFDIILFALIAAFLVLRLRNVLGRRDGFEDRNQDPFQSSERDGPSQWGRDTEADANGDRDTGFADNDRNDNVIPLPGHGNRDAAEAPFEPAAEAEADTPAGQLNAGMAKVAAADPSFNGNEFIQGARVAFEMILTAYAQGDVRTLKNLLSTEVFENFQASIRQREEAGEVLEETLVGIRTAEIVEAYMQSRDAHVTVKFVSEQVNALLNASGDVIDGNPNQVITVTDFWTFARDTKSRNPNWELVATRSLD